MITAVLVFLYLITGALILWLLERFVGASLEESWPAVVFFWPLVVFFGAGWFLASWTDPALTALRKFIRGF